MPRLLLLILFLPASLCAQTAEEKKATIRYLVGLQQPDGGFVAAAGDPKATSSLRATSAAVRGIKYLGGEVPNRDRTLQFVKACFLSATGAFTDNPGGTADPVATAIGVMALTELEKEPRLDRSVAFLATAKSFEERRLAVAGMEAAGKFGPVVKDWFAEIRKTQNPDGTYGRGDGQARETGGVIAMFLRAGEKLRADERTAVVAALRAGQRADGGFGRAGEKGSDGETTYRVMRAFHLLDEQPKDVAGLKAFFAKCRNPDGGYGVAPGQPSSVGGTYYAAAVSHWLPK